MKDTIFTIKENKRIAPQTFQMVLEGDCSQITSPGQFVNIQLDGFYLRRPISVCDLEKDALTIIYKTVGKGTACMAGKKAGETLSYGDYTFQVISLAGHTLGQLGLYEPNHQIVFSADHIIEGLSPIVGTSYLNEHLLQQYFRSLEQFKTQYHSCMIYPAHGNSFSNPAPVAETIISAYRKKLLQMHDILENSAEALTVQEVAFRAYSIQNLPSDANRFFQVKSILTKTFSCLEYLYDQRYCERMEQNGMLFYR